MCFMFLYLDIERARYKIWHNAYLLLELFNNDINQNFLIKEEMKNTH